jgi:hypothetical protein
MAKPIKPRANITLPAMTRNRDGVFIFVKYKFIKYKVKDKLFQFLCPVVGIVPSFFKPIKNIKKS